jgi:hypothetical protein
MKINEILAEARPVKLTGKTTPTQGGSALGSFLRGAGATQGAAAADAYANANALAPGVRQTKIRKPNAIQVPDTSAADAKRARFIAVIKQQADRQGSIAMSDIGKRIPKQGEYADPARRREAVRNIAQELQQQGVIVTDAPTTVPTSAPAPLPTIGGIGPSDPRYAALAARTRHAPPTPTV